MMVMLDVEGYVWCSKHGEVHSDTLNPHGYIEDGNQDYCVPEDHQALYRSNPELEKIMAEPVRSNPVPLTVRRHTEESRKIWFDNLYDALPNDLLPADKERITEALLDVTITMGNELRRKRLIDKLMHAAEQMEDWSGHKTVPVPQMTAWSDLLADAAEEIRSFM
jgi:hypothetical protein